MIRTLRGILGTCVVLLAVGLFAPSNVHAAAGASSGAFLLVADATSALTHRAMLRSISGEAVTEMLAEADLNPALTVTVRPGTYHASNGVVSDLVISQLSGQGFRVLTAGVPPDPEDAVPDTLGATTVRVPSPEQVLEFDINQYSVRYVGEGRPFFLGPKRVERAVAVDLSCRVRDDQDRVSWVGHGDGLAVDRISKGKLAVYESDGVTPAPLPSKSIMRIVEPVMVVGIVTGLVYLFYTNQN